MDLSKHFILLNGEPKTLQIDTIRKNGTTGYSVRFKNNVRTYNYTYGKVTWLSKPEWKDPTHCKVYVNGKLKKTSKTYGGLTTTVTVAGESSSMATSFWMTL